MSLDWFIQHKTDRLDKYGNTIYLIFGLIPSAITESEITVNDLTEQYQYDLLVLINAQGKFY